MIPQPRPLIEVFSDIPDMRQSRGKRHPLSAILALSCCAMLCGSRSYPYNVTCLMASNTCLCVML
jgi:hypothetical protein